MSALEPARGREPRIPVAPNLAMRVGILGFIAMALFAIIFFRLWFLQVLSGEQYVQQANANKVRELPIAAPRGQIFDREGHAIVTNQTTNAVQIVPQELPDAEAVAKQAIAYEKAFAIAEAAYKEAGEAVTSFERGHRDKHRSAAERHELHELKAADHLAKVPLPPLPAGTGAVRSLFDRLGRVLRMRPTTIDERVLRGLIATAYAPVTIKTDAGRGVLTELGERQNEYPGIVQEPVSTRDYPYGPMAAQVIGYVDQVSPEELKKKAFKGVKASTIVGQAGLEYYYDRYLRGQPGIKKIEVDAGGQPIPARPKEVAPQAGHSLKISLSLPLQREGEKALTEAIEKAQAGNKPATGGAFVAINPLNGEIYGMGSTPSFDPERFAKPLTNAEYAELVGSGTVAGKLVDRATEGEYPTGSTFKPITAMAALEAGILSPGEGLGAGSCIKYGGEEFCNAGKEDFGSVDLVHALEVSSDTYFFEVGERANSHGTIIQRMAKELGVGDAEGLDLPNEFTGVLPDKAWREEVNGEQEECLREKAREAGHKKVCEIVSEVRPWTTGDDMHLAVGQGDLLTNPLQMAVAYSTLANAYMNEGHGHVVTPHLGLAIDESKGGLVQALNHPAKRAVTLNYSDLSLVMEGIHDATSGPGGTSTDVWAGWNQGEHPVYGKTGTAEHYGQEDQAWYMCYIADSKHPIVIAVTVEKGGFGAETAAPVARLIASEWFHKPLKYVVGTSKTL